MTVAKKSAAVAAKKNASKKGAAAKPAAKRVAFTRGSTNADGMTRKDLCYREYLRLPLEDRRSKTIIAFAEKHNFGLSGATICAWVSSWNRGGKRDQWGGGGTPVRSAGLPDPAKKPAKRAAKKPAKKA